MYISHRNTAQQNSEFGRPADPYACPDCRGTGKFISWAGRIVGPCHKCKGTGKLKTTAEQRATAKQKRMEKKARDAQQNMEWFTDDHPELAAYLVEVKSWNGFAQSLPGAVEKYGDLTEKQFAAAKRMHEKHIAKQAAKVEAPADDDLRSLVDMFAKAGESMKKPMFRADGLKLSLAPSTGRNAGHIYVVEEGDYRGKITPEGRWMPVNGVDLVERLKAIAANPFDAAVRYGRETGSCSCCGRELTNKLSIELGIGPICREKWGI